MGVGYSFLNFFIHNVLERPNEIVTSRLDGGIRSCLTVAGGANLMEETF